MSTILDSIRQSAQAVMQAVAPPPPPPPRQSPEEIQAKVDASTSDPKQRELLTRGYTQAQEKGDGALWKQTEDLGTLYHDREVLQLSRSLGANDAAPDGWHKASAAELKQYGITSSQLHPQGSGFNAELFIPDPAVYGKDAQPVLAFEGTDFGDVQDVNADVAQAMGNPEEYYERAMSLATTVSEHSDGNVIYSGHSLGGGLATAAAQVTGGQGIVSNPAGVHSDTTARFLSERGLTPPADADAGITTYAVDGDLLTTLQRDTQGLTQRNADALATDLNLGVAIYNHYTGNSLPTNASGDQLRDLPDAAGTVVTLDATNKDGSARPDVIPLEDILADINSTADKLSLPGVAAEKTGGFFGKLGDIVDGATDWIGDRLADADKYLPGDVLKNMGGGIKTVGDVVDNIGEFARASGKSIEEVNRDLAVVIAAGKQGLSGDVRDTFGEMIDRHSFGVLDASLGTEVGSREDALEAELG
ncbi:MAG TPA: hypothetical protein VFF71_08610 [Luteimonas sp.]|nr:hypothetical protein [Luteimonas sp.]